MFLDQTVPDQVEPETAPQSAGSTEQLPTMADLVALEDELNVIDKTLAELQD